MAESQELLLKTLERKLDQKLEFYEKTVKENEAIITASKNNLRMRCQKMKEMKKELDAVKKSNQEREDTFRDLTKSKDDLTDYIELLKSDTERCEKATNEIAEDQNRRVKEMKEKWKTYKAQYETLPLAVLRREEETRTMKYRIELLVKEQKLKEMKKVVAQREEIDRKLRNSLVIDFVKINKEIKLENIQHRAVITARTKLMQELKQQEETIAELEKKKHERLVSQQQKTAEKPVKKVPKLSSLISLSQRQTRCQIPQFDLVDSAHSLAIPSRIIRKDKTDTISVTSSVIDGLFEPTEQRNSEIDGSGQRTAIEDREREETALEEGGTSNVDEEGAEFDREKSGDRSPKNSRSIGDPSAANDSEKSEVSEMMDSAALDEVRGYESPRSELPTQIETRGYYNPVDEGRSELVDSNDDVLTQREGQRGLLEFGEPEAKVPKISSIEKVRVNLPVGKKNTEEDSVRPYFDGSESNESFNWKPSQRLSSLFSNTAPDYQSGIIDTEVQSNIDSEISMQIEEMMNEFRVTFSPDQRGSGREEYCPNIRDEDDRTRRQAGPSAPITQIGQSQAAVPFLHGFRNSGASTNTEGSKKEQFFLSMF